MCKKTIINIILVIVSVKMMALSVVIFTWDRSEPPFHLVPDMDHQPKIRAQSGSMYTPPTGTVSYGNLKADTHFYQGKDSTGKFVKKMPVTVDSLLLKRGQERFNIYCTPCHDGAGSGQGAVPLAATGFAPITDFRDPRLLPLEDGYFFDIITHGKGEPGVPKTMPSYAAQIPEADRWAIVAYIRALQKLKGEKLTKFEPVVELSEEAKKGEALFKGKGVCFTCHTQMVPGVKPLGPLFKGLWGKEEETNKGKVIVDEAYVFESIRKPLEKVLKGYQPVMPPVTKEQLSDDEIRLIIEYMKALK